MHCDWRPLQLGHKQNIWDTRAFGSVRSIFSGPRPPRLYGCRLAANVALPHRRRRRNVGHRCRQRDGRNAELEEQSGAFGESMSAIVFSSSRAIVTLMIFLGNPAEAAGGAGAIQQRFPRGGCVGGERHLTVAHLPPAGPHRLPK